MVSVTRTKHSDCESRRENPDLSRLFTFLCRSRWKNADWLSDPNQSLRFSHTCWTIVGNAFSSIHWRNYSSTSHGLQAVHNEFTFDDHSGSRCLPRPWCIVFNTQIPGFNKGLGKRTVRKSERTFAGGSFQCDSALAWTSIPVSELAKLPSEWESPIPSRGTQSLNSQFKLI